MVVKLQDLCARPGARCKLLAVLLLLAAVAGLPGAARASGTVDVVGEIKLGDRTLGSVLAIGVSANRIALVFPAHFTRDLGGQSLVAEFCCGTQNQPLVFPLSLAQSWKIEELDALATVEVSAAAQSGPLPAGQLCADLTGSAPHHGRPPPASLRKPEVSRAPDGIHCGTYRGLPGRDLR